MKLIIIVASIAVIVVAGFFIFKSCKNAKENEVTDNIDKIINKQAQEQPQSMDNLIAQQNQKEYFQSQMKELHEKVKQDPNDSASIQMLQNINDQLKSFDKSISDVAAYYKNALDGDDETMGLLQIIEEFDGTKAANIARIYAAQNYEKLSNIDEKNKKDYIDKAVELLEGFEPEDNSTISAAAIYMLGNLYVNQGKKQEGIDKMIEAADNCKDESLSPIFLEQAGKVYESMNKDDAALKLYQQIEKEYAQSALCKKENGISQLDIDIMRISK